jgi:hypothetical protein
MRAAWIAGALIALSAVATLLACPTVPSRDDCPKVCHALDRCGLLPSALGAGTTSPDWKENCASRCETSASETYDKIQGCTTELDADTTTCSDPCGTLQRCLVNAYPDSGIAGRASLRVVLLNTKLDPEVDAGAGKEYQPPPLEICSGVLCADDGGCLPPTGHEFTPPRASAWCRLTSASMARTFILQQGATSWAASERCEQLLANGATLEGIPPGRGRAGVELRGVRVLDAGAGNDAIEQAFCHVLYGQELGLAAGTSYTAGVPLPENLLGNLFPCEEGPVACHDHDDNDKNGVLDCDEPQCASECVDAGTSSTDAGAADADAGPIQSVDGGNDGG